MGRRYLLAEATVDEQDLEELIGWLRQRPWLTQGEVVREFERAWASWLGVRHAVMVNSGSSANLLMYHVLGLSGRLRNRRVVVPSVGWATTVAPALQLGFEPVMCEADPDTFGLDRGCLEGLLRRHEPGAVIGVHVLGVPCAMDALADLRRRHGFLLMEDACAAVGSRFEGRLVGTFGDLSSFSFFFGHHVSTIEGGMVCTDDDELHDLLLITRSHGWPKDLAPEKEAALARAHGVRPFNRTFTFYQPGFNLRSSDLNARIGLSQMRKIDRVVAARIRNHLRYQERFAGAEGFRCQANPRAQICSIAFVALAASAGHRDRIAEALRARGIETRPLGGGNMSRQPFWTATRPAEPFAVADRIAETAFQLPNHARLEPADVDAICDVVLAVPR